MLRKWERRICRKWSIKYEAAIAQKGEELEALKSKIKEIPLAEMMSDKTKTLKDEVSKIAESTGKLKDRMAIYAKELTAQK
mgnify:CR=1 FL=1